MEVRILLTKPTGDFPPVVFGCDRPIRYLVFGIWKSEPVAIAKAPAWAVLVTSSRLKEGRASLTTMGRVAVVESITQHYILAKEGAIYSLPDSIVVPRTTS